MTDQRDELLRAALDAARRGWRVFPLRPGGKRPAFPDHDEAHCTHTDRRCRGGHQGWEQRATSDPDRIRRAWQVAPFNIGIACGPSGLVVIDLDAPKPGHEVPPSEWRLPGVRDGADVLAVLAERQQARFPTETHAVRTGRGGMHLYFRHPDGPELRNTTGGRTGSLGWLIDTRAYGGYVVAAGSLVDGRPYTVIHDAEPEPLPDWLVGLLTQAAPKPPLLECPSLPGQVSNLPAYAQAALQSEAQRVASAARGGRNHALNKAAYHLGRLVGAGVIPEPVATQTLIQAASHHFGSTRADMSEAEAHTTIRSGLHAGAARPRSIPA
jgi:hypothetical protein